jgi:two-component system sensor histidine kinase DctS
MTQPAPLVRIPQPRSRRRLNLYLAMPKIAIALLVVAVIGLLWVLQEQNREDRRATLIADILWLEQNLRFELVGGRERLAQLAASLPAEGDPLVIFDDHSRQLRKTNPEIVQVLWLDARGRLQRASPPADHPYLTDGSVADADLLERMDIARRLGRGVYTAPYEVEITGTQFEVVVPLFRAGQFDGALVGVHSLRSILDHSVPWWFTERYRLDVLNNEGQVIGSKSNVVGKAQITYSLALDELGQGVSLRAGIARADTDRTARFVVAAILVLAAAVFWSLWAIRGLIRRRMIAEEQLREANAFRESMENSLLTGLRARDLDGRLIYANPAFCRMVGFSETELLGHLPPMPYWAPESVEETMRIHQEVLHGHAPPDGFEMRFRRKSGEHFDALVYEAPLIDGNGEHIGWMGSVLDITERKRIAEFKRQQEDKLQHTARLVAMGEMASTLAHELNQPLAAIASYSAGCLNKLESGRHTEAELTSVLRKINAQSQRAGKIIRRVHDFIRRREPRREPCAVAEVVDEAVTLFEPQAKKHGVRIACHLQGGLPEVSADPTMLEQVMINLLRNAVEAMVETPEDARRIDVSVRRDGDRIVVRVSDNGPGIPPESMEMLFTPFFTTKPDGMGMGMAICRSIIEFHHGRLDARNSEDGGAEISFFLPIIPL